MQKKTLFHYPKLNDRKSSYDYLENFIIEKTHNYSTPINTQLFLAEFQEKIKEMNNLDFAFLLIHSGTIPESYVADSSEESFYSKLCEDIIREWAIRIGFTKSYLPTEKSSTEDVTILTNKNQLIVCDAKAFRLGRSQSAPNVKDMLKEGDIQKWLHNHDPKTYEHLGGLVVFPSTHDWKSSSDFYQYTTNKNLPIIALHYDHLAFMLFSEMSADSLVNVYKNYSQIFPNKLYKKDKNNVAEYYNKLEGFLFNMSKNFIEFKDFKRKVISEKGYHTYKNLEIDKKNIKALVNEKIKSIDDIEKLRDLASKSLMAEQSSHLKRQGENIRKFRNIAEDYHED